MEATTKSKEIENNVFNDAISTEIEMIDGKKSLVTVIFNCKEVSFEELVLGLKVALKNCENIKSIRPQTGTLKNGKFERHFLYPKLNLMDIRGKIIN